MVIYISLLNAETTAKAVLFYPILDRRIFIYFSKFLKFLLNVTEFTIKHQKLPKIWQSPPQELRVSPHSGLYLVVF